VRDRLRHLRLRGRGANRHALGAVFRPVVGQLREQRASTPRLLTYSKARLEQIGVGDAASNPVPLLPTERLGTVKVGRGQVRQLARRSFVSETSGMPGASLPNTNMRVTATAVLRHGDNAPRGVLAVEWQKSHPPVGTSDHSRLRGGRQATRTAASASASRRPKRRRTRPFRSPSLGA